MTKEANTKLDPVDALYPIKEALSLPPWRSREAPPWCVCMYRFSSTYILHE